jgi:hypothetical protein
MVCITRSGHDRIPLNAHRDVWLYDLGCTFWRLQEIYIRDASVLRVRFQFSKQYEQRDSVAVGTGLSALEIRPAHRAVSRCNSKLCSVLPNNRPAVHQVASRLLARRADYLLQLIVQSRSHLLHAGSFGQG